MSGEICFEVKDDVVIKHTSMHEIEGRVYKAEIVMTKEIFQECYKSGLSHRKARETMAELKIDFAKMADAFEKTAKERGLFAGWWVPVSERLPEDRREVLVTAYWHETYQVMMASYFGDGLWWCVPFNNCGEHMQRLNPKAWMPLPEPYKAERGGK